MPGARRLRRLGVTEVTCAAKRPDLAGRVEHLTEPYGGEMSLNWPGFEEWLGGFLLGPKIMNKRRKLAATKVEERHCFVGVSQTIRWEALRVLDRDVGDIPPSDPALPVEITHLWLMAADSPGRCLAWWPRIGWFDTRCGVPVQLDA